MIRPASLLFYARELLRFRLKTNLHRHAPGRVRGNPLRACKSHPELERLVELWPSLPEKIRASIIALIEATVEEKRFNG